MAWKGEAGCGNCSFTFDIPSCVPEFPVPVIVAWPARPEQLVCSSSIGCPDGSLLRGPELQQIRDWRLVYRSSQSLGLNDMSLEQLGHTILEFIKLHQAWAAPIVFALAFAESLALLSFLVPAWAVLVGIGAMMKTAEVAFFPVLLAGALGAALGDWLSYWIGYTCKDRIAQMRPFSTHPNLLAGGEAFIRK